MQRRTRVGVTIAAVITVILVTCGTPATGEPRSELQERVSDSLVLVRPVFGGYVLVPADLNSTGRSEYSQELSLTFVCSGFPIGDGHLVATAGQCVDSNSDTVLDLFRAKYIQSLIDARRISDDDASRLFRRSVNESWAVSGGVYEDTPPLRSLAVAQPRSPHATLDTFVEANVVDTESSVSGDNGLLSIGRERHLTPLTMASGATRVGAPVIAAGFDKNDVVSEQAAPSPTFREGAVSGPFTNSNGTNATRSTVQYVEGMVGGPVLSVDTGDVIGVSVSTVSADDVSYHVTDTASTNAFLRRNGIKAGKEEGSGVPAWLIWTASSVGAVLVVGAVVLAILVVRSRRRRPQLTYAPAPQAVPPQRPL